jgi:hypothetical protein
MSKTTSELKRNAVAALLMMAVVLAGTAIVMTLIHGGL